MTKRLQAAYAARSGVECALLAAGGVTGPCQPLEGVSGIHALYTPLEAALASDLGLRYESSAMTFKKFASCMCNHTPIEACLQLLSRSEFSSREIKAVTVTISPYMNRLTGGAFEPGDTPQVSAQFNVRYSVASTLLRGRFNVTDIQNQSVLDPQVNCLAARVNVEVDEASGPFGPARIRVVSTADSVHCHAVDSPASPLLPLLHDLIASNGVLWLPQKPIASDRAEH